jgi:general stress protein 26
MSTKILDPTDVEDRLWKAVEKRGTGMLGLTASGQHFQPMTAFVERGAGQLWFFARSDTDMTRDVGDGASAMFVFQDDHLQACIGGGLTLSRDPERLEKYWNTVVAAWYPAGKDDPLLAMIRMDCVDAEVWLSEGRLTKFAWEIAKANATHRTPDIGGRAHLEFH